MGGPGPLPPGTLPDNPPCPVTPPPDQEPAGAGLVFVHSGGGESGGTGSQGRRAACSYLSLILRAHRSRAVGGGPLHGPHAARSGAGGVASGKAHRPAVGTRPR